MSKTVYTDVVSQKLSWNNIGTVDKLQRADSIKVSSLLNRCGNAKCGKSFPHRPRERIKKKKTGYKPVNSMEYRLNVIAVHRIRPQLGKRARDRPRFSKRKKKSFLRFTPPRL